MIIKLPFKRCIVTEAAVTAAGTIGSAALNALSQHRTNSVNREQAEHAFRMQQEAIREQNRYNSPAEQVLRMKAAGLNPSLAYGADGSMVGNQADIPAYNAIPAEAPNIGNVGTGIADAIRTGIEVKDLERRQALAKAEISLQSAQEFAAVMMGNRDYAQAEETLNLMGYKAELMDSEIALNAQNVIESVERVENLKLERAEIESRVNLNYEQIHELASRANLSDTQAYAILQRLPHEIMQMDANAALDYMQTDVAREQVFQIRREVEHIGWSEEFQRHQFNTDLKKWGVEQKKWFEEMKQNRRMNLINSFSNILSFTNGAMIMRTGGKLPPASNPRAPITSSHHGTGTYTAPPKPQRHPAPGTKY